MRVALRAVESARQAAEAEGPDARAAHVGHHLIGKGRRELEADVAWRPRSRQARAPVRVRARDRRLPRGDRARDRGAARRRAPAYARHGAARRGRRSPWRCSCSSRRASSRSRSSSALAARFAPPRRLPRLDLSAGRPRRRADPGGRPDAAHRAWRGSTALLEHLEVLALGNLDPRIHFAILGDFTDAAARDMPGDAAILAAARSGDRGAERAPRRGPGRSVLPPPPRAPVEPAGGRVDGLGAEARQARGAEPAPARRDRHELRRAGGRARASSPRVRYCITLDSDTRLPRDAARKLIGIIAHPLNRPHFDPRSGRVTDGYGILQPRVSVATASAAGSRFARIFAGHTGVDPYTTAVSDTYQDLFGEGSFTGKGLYDVDAFTAALDGRVPDNTLLSHDLFEGMHARTGLVTDVEVVDDYPSSVLAHARRQHRWARGDWQILPLAASRSCPRARGSRATACRSSRAGRSSTTCGAAWLAPATVALLLLAWTVLPGEPRGLDRRRRGGARLPALPARCSRRLGGPRPHQPLARFLRAAPRRTPGAPLAPRRAPARLPRQPGLRDGARHRRHARPARDHAAAAARVGDGRGERGRAAGRAEAPARPFLVEMAASPAIALAGLAPRPGAAPGRARRGGARPRAVGRRAAHRPPASASRSPRRTSSSARGPRVPARRGPEDLGYFEAFMGPEDHWLPPDNFQEVPERRVAHRTSPTNIGMGLLSTLAAHDLGFIPTGELVERVDATLTTMEGWSGTRGTSSTGTTR